MWGERFRGSTRGCYFGGRRDNSRGRPGHSVYPSATLRFCRCSDFSRRYLSVYRDTPGVSADVCLDVDLDRARLATAILREGHAETQPYATDDFQAALAEESDVVVINTPNDLHSEQAVAALERGKHVLLQETAGLDARGCPCNTGRGQTVNRSRPYLHELLRPSHRA
jgi:hypothetical protein